MSTVTTAYNRYSILAEEQRAAMRAGLDKARQENAADPAKTGSNDAVAFSDKGRQLAASSRLTREEMEALDYQSLLEFEAEDGSRVTVDLAQDATIEGNKYLAARITITRPDGSEESLFFGFDVIRPEEAEEEAAGETAVAAAEEAEADATETAEETEPSLMELIEKYGLNEIPDASESLSAAIRKRIEEMIKATEETAEEAENLESVKAEREARNDLAENNGAAVAASEGDDAGIGQEINAVSGKTARTLASYARTASSLGAGMGSFSRRY